MPPKCTGNASAALHHSALVCVPRRVITAFESVAAVQAGLDLKAGKPVEKLIRDPGFAIHPDNLPALATCSSVRTKRP
jgi:hypothetical protein